MDIWSFNVHKVRIQPSKSRLPDRLSIINYRSATQPNLIQIVIVFFAEFRTRYHDAKLIRERMSTLKLFQHLGFFSPPSTLKPCGTAVTTQVLRTWHWLITSAEESGWAKHLLTPFDLFLKSFHSEVCAKCEVMFEAPFLLLSQEMTYCLLVPKHTCHAYSVLNKNVTVNNFYFKG